MDLPESTGFDFHSRSATNLVSHDDLSVEN